MAAPGVISQPKPGNPIDVDGDFYGRLGREPEIHSTVEKFMMKRPVGMCLAGAGGSDLLHRRGRGAAISANSRLPRHSRTWQSLRPVGRTGYAGGNIKQGNQPEE